MTPTLIVGILSLAVLAILAVVAPLLWGEQAAATDPLSGGLPASPEHLFGTDRLGRDVFLRTLVATQATLVTCALATIMAAAIGITLGAGIWVAGPRVRHAGLRLIDTMIAYPAVILALVICAILGPGQMSAVIGIGIATAPAFARLTANLTASIATRDFVTSSRLLGVPPVRLLRRHILPNVAEPLLVLFSVAFSASLRALSGLSFLGLGVQAPDYDWGSMLGAGLQDIYTNPWVAIGPAVAIVLAGLAAGLTGDGLAASASDTGARVRGAARRAVRGLTSTTPAVLTSTDGLVVEDLVVRRADGVAVVDGVSFTVAPGEIVGVVGESGSGKSVTAMSVARLLADGLSADAGRMSLGDIDLRRASGAQLANSLGIVYQDPGTSFNPTLRIGGQLTETLRVHDRYSPRRARAAAVRALERVRVTHPAQRLRQHPHELSGGMRQRAMIASALLTSPKLLLADEPTTALDVTVQKEILTLLREVNERDGVSVLMISHDLGVIADVCDRVLVMYAGRLVEELTVAGLRAGAAMHPYTRALLSATPSVHADRPLQPIPGRPPAPENRGAGCPFASRCPLVQPVCHEVMPAAEATPTGSVSCHAVSQARVDEEVLG